MTFISSKNAIMLFIVLLVERLDNLSEIPLKIAVT
jgi:hypothetical protein